MMFRAILTALAVAVYGWFNEFWMAAAPIVAGNLSTLQFQNSDAAYVASRIGMNHLETPFVLSSILFFAALGAIWWKPLKGLFAGILLASILLIPQPSKAYYDKSDYNESYFILPNESAFFIPDVGDNKNSQAQFGSVDYLKANKIPAKRYTVPHVKLENSGLWSNFYVPAGRLIVIDRTPVSREWVDSADRGTSHKKQGFPCQDNSGLDITVGVTLGVSVTEDQAPLFLYRFGVNPPAGNRSQPEVIFQTLFNGKSLAEATDGPVRNKIQALVCDQIAGHSLDEDNKQATKIMADIETKVKEYLTSVGITLDYIGWADTFGFDPIVQNALNRQYVATKDADIAQKLGPQVDTLQKVANAQATRTLADKWNGQVPASVSLWWLPEGISNVIQNIFGGKK